MLFLRFGELKRDFTDVLQRVCRFLNVEDNETWDTKPRAKNATHIPRSLRVRRLVCKIFGRESFMDRVDRKFNRRSEAGYPPMQEHLRNRLKVYFEEPNRKLQTITGLDLNEWR